MKNRKKKPTTLAMSAYGKNAKKIKEKENINLRQLSLSLSLSQTFVFRRCYHDKQ